MPVSFYVCLVGCLIAIGILLVVLVIRVDQLTTIKNQLYKILDNVRPIDNSIQKVLSTIIDIRKDTAKITGLLDKDEEEPEEKPDISEGGWTIDSCPVCGGPAKMFYDRDVNGYFIQCARHDSYNTCDYGTVAGGPTRLSAATAWNRAVVNYCRLKDVVRLPYMEKDSHAEKKPQAANTDR